MMPGPGDRRHAGGHQSDRRERRTRLISIPEVLQNHAVAAGAGSWLGDLPVLLNRLEEQWDVTVGLPFAGATEAYVAEATTGAGWMCTRIDADRPVADVLERIRAVVAGPTKGPR